MQKGFARPGYFFIDSKGIIQEKFFEAKYRERLTGNSIVAKLFPELGQEVTETVEAPHLQLALEQSDRTGVPGTRITLAAEVRLPSDVHVYAPGAQGYKPIKLVIDPIPEVELKPALYPQSKTLSLACDQRARTCLRGDFPHQPGYKSELRHGVCRFARKGWENVHDHGKAGLSGLRQNQVLYAHVRSGEMATASVSPRSNPSPRGHSTQISRRLRNPERIPPIAPE